METRSSLSSVRVIGFDLDQTLYPKSPLVDEKIQEYLYQKIAAHAGVSLEEAERLFKERYRAGAGMSGRETMRDLGLPNGAELVQEALENADIASTLSPNLETNELLADLRTRYEGMDLITGSNMEQTKKKLEAIGLTLDTFSNVITADQSTKSDGSSYTHWLSLYPHLVPQEFLYIGDRVRSDHEIPSKLGIQTALVYVSHIDPVVTALQVDTLADLQPLLLP